MSSLGMTQSTVGGKKREKKMDIIHGFYMKTTIRAIMNACYSPTKCNIAFLPTVKSSIAGWEIVSCGNTECNGYDLSVKE